MIITRTGVAGTTWQVKDASSQDVQDLVAFADTWNGVDVKAADGDYGQFIVSVRTSAEAEHFEHRFQDSIEKS